MSSFSMWQFCTEIKAPADALNWLEKQISAAPEEREDPWCHCSRESADVIRVWTDPLSEEDGDPFQLTATVAKMQKLFHITEPWHITWAVVRDRPIIDGFRGGAAVCYMGKTTQIDTGDWTRDIIEKMQNAEKNPPLDADQITP
jgi:hypothetical protein